MNADPTPEENQDTENQDTPPDEQAEAPEAEAVPEEEAAATTASAPPLTDVYEAGFNATIASYRRMKEAEAGEVSATALVTAAQRTAADATEERRVAVQGVRDNIAGQRALLDQLESSL